MSFTLFLHQRPNKLGPATLATSLYLGKAQVRLDLTDIVELLLGVRSRDGRRHDHVVTLLPVNRRHDTLLVARLQGVDHTQNLSRVAAGRRGVHHGETDLLVGVDDEDGPDGEGDALLGDVVQVALVDHVVQEGDLSVSVGDNGELQVGRRDFVDVLNPLAVGAEVVGALESPVLAGVKLWCQGRGTYKTNHLHVALLELILELGKGTQLRGANGREVSRVREQNGPAVADELVEVNVAVGRLRIEVGSCSGSVSLSILVQRPLEAYQ